MPPHDLPALADQRSTARGGLLARMDRLPHRRVRGIPKVWCKWLVIAIALSCAWDAGLFGSIVGGAEAEHLAEAGSHAHDEGGGGHAGPAGPVLLGIVVILFFAKLGGDVFERVGMPAVLGELVVGVLIGNWVYLGGLIGAPLGLEPIHLFDFLDKDTSLPGEVLFIISEIGVVLLLFEVGLESRVADLVKVGKSALLVAILGVVAPIALGYGVSTLILEDGGWQVPLFIGATLCATSVGITARVLKDLGKSQLRESRIILGAAVIDDVLGLIVLAVVSGVIGQSGSGEEFGAMQVVSLVGIALGFLAGAMILGAIRFPKLLFKLASRLRGHGLLVTTALVICFGFSYLATLAGLAAIIGAFAAGLILERAQFEEEGHLHELEEAIAPLTALLVPIFFVEMGMQVSLSSFADPSVWLLAGSITVMAILGKQACSLGVLEPGLNKTSVGLGMIPRGEVGLIFANEGRKLVTSEGNSVIDSQTYSAVVVMVMITTMITPPLLKWSLKDTGPAVARDEDTGVTGAPPDPGHG